MMKGIIKHICVLIGLLIIASTLYGQTLDYSVDKPNQLLVGTPFKLYVNIETALTDSIFSPKLDTLDVFIRTGDIIQTEEIIEDKKFSKLVLRFQGFDTGEFTFPALEFLVEKENGEQQILKTNEFLVNIQSVIVDSSQVIKDISGPLEIGYSFWDYLLPILLLLLIIFGIYMMRRYLKRKPIEEEKPVIHDTRPAWQICLEMLHRLQKEDLLGKGEFLEFYYRLSIILRSFIELHYNVKAVEMTTSEIRQKLQLNSHKEKGNILELLSLSDRVKFAKFSPTYKDSEEKYRWLESYLKSFKSENREVDNA